MCCQLRATYPMSGQQRVWRSHRPATAGPLRLKTRWTRGGEDVVAGLVQGDSWDVLAANSEVALLRERIQQLEQKLKDSEVAVSLQNAAGRNRGVISVDTGPALDPGDAAEEELVEALMWAQTEAAVFAGISSDHSYDQTSFPGVLARMLANAGAAGVLSEQRLQSMATALFRRHSNPYTRKLDLAPLRELVAKQRKAQERAFVRDWVKSDASFASQVAEAVDAKRGEVQCIGRSGPVKMPVQLSRASADKLVSGLGMSCPVQIRAGVTCA